MACNARRSKTEVGARDGFYCGNENSDPGEGIPIQWMQPSLTSDSKITSDFNQDPGRVRSLCRGHQSRSGPGRGAWLSLPGAWEVAYQHVQHAATCAKAHIRFYWGREGKNIVDGSGGVRAPVRA